MKLSMYAAILLALGALVVHAEVQEDRGYTIAREADKRDSGFGDSSNDSVFTLRNAQGEESIREFAVKTLEVPGDGDKDLAIFHRPADVRGTAVLTFSHGVRPDDQWLFLPELKRIKRISSVNKSGPFLGSEFAFEDIASWEMDKYKYRYLRDEAQEGNECFVVENIPAYEYSGYSKRVEWVDKTIYQPRKIEFYDRKNALLKTLTFHEYQQYLGRYWRASRLEMVNHQNGKSTTLARRNYKFQNGFKESDFSESALKSIQ